MSNAGRGRGGNARDSGSFSSFQSTLPKKGDVGRAVEKSPIAIERIPVHVIDIGDEIRPVAAPALVDAVKRHGLLEPLIVQKREGRYRLLGGAVRLAAAVAAEVPEAPCIVHEIGDDEAHALAAALAAAADGADPALGGVDSAIANSLSSVISSTTLLAENGPSQARAVAVDMIRAEARRALCLLHSARELRYGVAAERRVASPRALVQHVVDMLLPESRLRGIAIESDVTVPEGQVVHANQEVLAHALCGAVLTIAAPFNAFHRPRVTVAAASEAAGRVTFSIAVQAPGVPPASTSTPSGPDAHALVSILALRRLADAGGGILSTARLTDGTRIALELPLT